MIPEFIDCDHPWGFDIQGRCCRCGRDLRPYVEQAMEEAEAAEIEFAKQIAGTDMDIHCEIVRMV